ncbi:MAG: hypothetical protein ABH812_02585, partial [bacterium]
FLFVKLSLFMTLVEGPPKQSIPFTLGEIPDLNGQSCQLLFVDRRNRVVNIGDQRLKGFDNISEGLNTHRDNDTLFLFSDKRKNLVVIDMRKVEPINIKSGGKRVKGFMLGTHVDLWFKDPYIGFEHTGIIIKRENGQGYDEVIRVYRNAGLGKLRVVAIPQEVS